MSGPNDFSTPVAASSPPGGLDRARRWSTGAVLLGCAIALVVVLVRSANETDQDPLAGWAVGAVAVGMTMAGLGLALRGVTVMIWGLWYVTSGPCTIRWVWRDERPMPHTPGRRLLRTLGLLARRVGGAGIVMGLLAGFLPVGRSGPSMIALAALAALFFGGLLLAVLGLAAGFVDRVLDDLDAAAQAGAGDGMDGEPNAAIDTVTLCRARRLYVIARIVWAGGAVIAVGGALFAAAVRENPRSVAWAVPLVGVALWVVGFAIAMRSGMIEARARREGDGASGVR